MGSSTGVWHSPVDGVLVHDSAGSGRSLPHASPAGSVSRTLAEAGSAVMSPMSTPAAKLSPVAVAIPPFGTGLAVRTEGPTTMSICRSTACGAAPAEEASAHTAAPSRTSVVRVHERRVAVRICARNLSPPLGRVKCDEARKRARAGSGLV